MATSRTVLVTGASRGIGLLTAKALAMRGHYVYASMRDLRGRNKAAMKELQAFSKAQNVSIEPIELDVTNDKSVSKAIKEIEKKRDLHTVVNNAGVMPTGLTEAYTLDQVRECMDINLYGVIRTHRAALPAMRARREGLFINISSAAGRLAIPFFGVYCASKWALEGYCESLHYELEPYNIQSIIIEPSGHGTDLVKTAPPPQDKDRLREYGDLAAGRERLLGMFQTSFEQDDPLTDANNIAMRIVNLVEQEGARPIRTQVGHDMGVSAINDATAPIQSAFVEGIKPVYLGASAEAAE